MDVKKLEGFNEGVPLVQRLVEHIRNLIITEEFPPGSQLPNELLLAQQFNVSRSTMRAALQVLERAGFVLRKRGKGTFIAEEPLKMNNLSLNWGVTQVIHSIGAVPGTTEINLYLAQPDASVVHRLNLEPNSLTLNIERVRTADGRCVVYTVDYIPENIYKILLVEYSLDQIRDYLFEHQSLYSLLEQSLVEPVHHARAFISPLTADKVVSKKLQIPEGSGILFLEQVDYTEDGDPIWVAHEYHVANAFTFSVYRSM